MKKSFALIVTVIVMTLLSALGIFGVSMLSADLEIAKQTMQSAEAFYIAEAGIQRTIGKLLSDSEYRASPTTLIDTLGEGVISVMVSKNSYVYTLNSTATVDAITRQIQQSVMVFEQGPQAFSYGVYCYGDIFMNDSDMTINGDAGTEGEIYQMSTNLNLNGELTEHLTLNQVTADLKSYQDVADYIYGDTQTFSNTTLSGIYYVKGDVIIQNDVNITGSIIAEGTITLNLMNSTIIANSGYPAFASEDDVLFNSAANSTITGLIYADDDVYFNNATNVDFTGSIVAADDVEFNTCNNFTVTFDPDIIANSPLYFSDIDSGGWTATPQPDWDEQ